MATNEGGITRHISPFSNELCAIDPMGPAEAAKAKNVLSERYQDVLKIHAYQIEDLISTSKIVSQGVHQGAENRYLRDKDVRGGRKHRGENG